jgi:hypothetical protein
MRSTRYPTRPLLRRRCVAFLPALVAATTLLACRSTGVPSVAASQATAAPATSATAIANEPETDIDWKAVDAAMGRAGAMQPGGVYRYGMPRSDLAVDVDGVRIKPSLALGSWLAFLPHGNGVLAMGDIVMLEREVNLVIRALQAGGIHQTAVHHHVLHESPRIVYAHVHGMGDPVQIARTVRAALEKTGTPAASPAAPAAAAAEPFGFDTVQVRQVLGVGGRVNGGVYQVNIPRAETIRDAGVVIPPSMGLATVMNFQPTGDGKAAITGDFVMTATEVNPVIRTLGEHGIEVTSLHNHLLTDEPRLFFMHFWANADAVTLTRGLRAALDRTNSAKPAP